MYWTLKRALPIGVLHVSVEAWTKKFVAATLTEFPFYHSKNSVTHQEICRIQRAFYRFETHCNISGPKVRTERGIFFGNYCCFENEQLCCIHDFVFRSLLQSIETLTYWRIQQCELPWDSWKSSVIVRNMLGDPRVLLELGLEKLHEMVNAENYMKWHLVLDDLRPQPGPGAFFDNNFINIHDQYIHVRPNDLTPTSYDPDYGPLCAWQWAHPGYLQANWIYQENREKLRRWGYVMWDWTRLEGVGIFWACWADLTEQWEFLENHVTTMERDYPFSFAELAHMGLEEWRQRSTVQKGMNPRKRGISTEDESSSDSLG